jgi:hypothetical protein
MQPGSPRPRGRPLISAEIINDVVEVKTKRSTGEPGAVAASSRFSVP